jgi:hypothetical protein
MLFNYKNILVKANQEVFMLFIVLEGLTIIIKKQFFDIESYPFYISYIEFIFLK